MPNCRPQFRMAPAASFLSQALGETAHNSSGPILPSQCGHGGHQRCVSSAENVARQTCSKNVATQDLATCSFQLWQVARLRVPKATVCGTLICQADILFPAFELFA